MSIEDTIRRDQFVQIISEIRASNDYLVVGIDTETPTMFKLLITTRGKHYETNPLWTYFKT